MRRFVVLVSSLFAIAAALVSGGSSAFAMRVAPPAGGSPVNVVPVVHHSAGLEAWQVALITVAGVAVLILAVLAARLMRLFHRHGPTAATS